MKTQITSLVHGSTHSATGVAGTRHAERQVIAEKVIAENPQFLNIEIKGIPLKLRANTSLSGKTTTYFASLTPEQYITLLGTNFGLSPKKPIASLIIQGDMTVMLNGNKIYNYLREADVTIL